MTDLLSKLASKIHVTVSWDVSAKERHTNSDARRILDEARIDKAVWTLEELRAAVPNTRDDHDDMPPDLLKKYGLVLEDVDDTLNHLNEFVRDVSWFERNVSEIEPQTEATTLDRLARLYERYYAEKCVIRAPRPWTPDFPLF